MLELATRSAGFHWRLAAGLAVAILGPAPLRGDTARQPAPPSIRVSPEALRMGAFYRGVAVRVEGELPPGSAALVVIRGPQENEFFDRKGRVGPVWLSVGRVQITRVPSLFIRLGGDEIRSLLDPASVEAHQLDDAAIGRSMSIRKGCGDRAAPTTPSGSEAAAPCATGVELDEGQARLVRSAYLDLKKQEGTYQVHPEAVHLDASAEGETRYWAELAWPRRARPGLYQVEVFAYRDRSLVGQASTVLPVEQTGIPARIGALANSHPLAYGALAVLAAVVTGLTMDSLVRRRRPRGAGRGPRARPPSAPRASEPVEAPAQDANQELQNQPVGTRG